jgi:hypothetical protein
MSRKGCYELDPFIRKPYRSLGFNVTLTGNNLAHYQPIQISQEHPLNLLISHSSRLYNIPYCLSYVTEENHVVMSHLNLKLNSNSIPPFESLPTKEGNPHHSAWGLYGDHDELRALNRLTNERVASATKDKIRSGVR